MRLTHLQHAHAGPAGGDARDPLRELPLGQTRQRHGTKQTRQVRQASLAPTNYAMSLPNRIDFSVDSARHVHAVLHPEGDLGDISPKSAVKSPSFLRRGILYPYKFSKS